MQGKKARGKEEINIIDVSGDDQMSQVDLMKHMTEEQDMRSYSKKGKDMPSAQQRRKHQITYLAFQVWLKFTKGDMQYIIFITRLIVHNNANKCPNN